MHEILLISQSESSKGDLQGFSHCASLTSPPIHVPTLTVNSHLNSNYPFFYKSVDLDL